LTFHDRPFRKTHDLVSLGKQCANIDATLGALVDRLDDLSEYAWAYRYPTGFAAPTSGDLEEARRSAQEAIKEIFRRLPEEVQEAMGPNGPSGDAPVSDATHLRPGGSQHGGSDCP
jgi:hypothetical protein